MSQRRFLDPAQVDQIGRMPEVVDVRLDDLDFMMNGMNCFYAAFFPCAAFHFAAPRLAVRGQLGPVLSRCTRTGPREMFCTPRRGSACPKLRPPGGRHERPCAVWFAWRYHQDALCSRTGTLAHAPAKPSMRGRRQDLATGVRTQSRAARAHGGTACGRAGKHLFRTGCDTAANCSMRLSSKPWMGLGIRLSAEMG